VVREGIFPPLKNFERPNPELHLDESPFFINTRRTDWPDAGGPRRAGVSAFGIGGTNAHVVIEQFTPQP
jgi:acyl transferase domain-containing protein